MRAAALLVLASALASVGLPVANACSQPADTTKISVQPVFVKKDLWVAAGFAVGTAVSFPLDKFLAKQIQREGLQHNGLLQGTATFLRVIGDPGAFIIGGSLYGIGRVTGARKVADLGLHGTEALAVGALTADVLKWTAGRARPYKDADKPHDFAFGRGTTADDYRSFPSGHSTAGFAAAAAVVSETSRWWPSSTWYIGPAMYGGAALIGLSRMYNNKHWGSDVWMGAAIGTFAGRKIVEYHHSHPKNRIDKWMLGGSITHGENGGYDLHLKLFPR